MTVLFFGLSGLDLLSALDTISDDYKKDIIEWIYAQQILPSNKDPRTYVCMYMYAVYCSVQLAAVGRTVEHAQHIYCVHCTCMYMYMYMYFEPKTCMYLGVPFSHCS